MRRRLPGAVIALGVVSLLTDASSEMIYPLLPAFLVTLGAGGAFIGLVEGVAETTSSFLKLASGYLADRLPRKKPLVVAGYGLASLVRPLVALARAPWQVLVVRFTDRIGKGIRTSPRDALIAQVTPDDRRGAAFGFHRAMDNAGALVGPLVAYALLHVVGVGHRGVFALAAIPAAAAMFVLVAAVPEKAVAPVPAPAKGPPTAAKLPRNLKIYLAILALFTLGNSTDFFLLLRAQDAGLAADTAPLLWALLSAVKSLLSTPFGAWSDRVGRKTVIIAGWLIYAGTYLGFALAARPLHIWALFIIYGTYFALTEGTEKALIADLAPAELRGRSYGLYNFVIGVCALPASLGFGVIWQRVGHGTAFLLGAGLAGAAAICLALLPTPRRVAA